eukprot:11518895-Alexandrium_andersonii.AAC.1
MQPRTRLGTLARRLHQHGLRQISHGSYPHAHVPVHSYASRAASVPWTARAAGGPDTDTDNAISIASNTGSTALQQLA